MRPFLDETVATFDCGLYSTALASALIIPDAAAAVEYPRDPVTKRPTNRVRYTDWYNTWVTPRPFGSRGVSLDGAFVWKVRNMMMHETALDFTDYGLDRVLFTAPFKSGKNVSTLLVCYDCGPKHEDGLTLDLKTFINRIVQGCSRWLEAIKDDPLKNDRMNALIQLRPEGRPPFIFGVPVIS